MLIGGLRKRAWTRLALTGLSFGFAVLAAMGLLATVTTRHAISTVHTANKVAAVWYDASVLLSNETEAMNDYLRSPDDVAIGLLDSAVGSTKPSIDWLALHIEPSGRRRVALVQAAYSGFATTMADLVFAARRGDRETAMEQAAQASLSATGLRKLLTVDILAQRAQLDADLDAVDRNNQRLWLIGLIAVPIDMVLLLICAYLLLSYQRRIERFAHSSQYQARHDALTGLGNRMLLDEVLTRVVRRNRITDGPVALLLLDLDGFKGINDTLGHHAGDLLLQQVATRLVGAVRQTDVVARLGGDEFAVILGGVGTPEQAAAVAGVVLESLQQPADLDGTTVDVTASIGVAMSPAVGGDARELLQQADIAMYTAKRGRLGVSVYADPVRAAIPRQVVLLGELRRGIDQHELVLYYQPKICAKTRQLTGVEALVRWQHPTRGLLNPAEFIPMAEQSGLMARLTDSVLAAALAQCQYWRLAGWEVPVAVNVGARCLLDRGFPDSVARRIAESGVPADMLTLEITETSLIGDPEQARELLSQLRELGVRLSIDDFGTGYSSMTHLTTMPVQEIKIDRSFVGSMHTEAKGRLIVRAIVNLGLSLGIDVVAEGIEDERTWAELAAWHCSIGQGNYLGRPMPPVDFIHWLARRTDAMIG